MIQVRRIKLPLNYLPVTPVAGAPSPLAVWQFDGGGSSLLDRTGNGYDLSMEVGTANHAVDDMGFGFTGFYFDADKRLVAPDAEALRIAKDRLGGGSAALTFEVIARVTNTANTPRIFSCYAGGESESTNHLYELIPHGSFAYWYSFNERGNGSNIDVRFTNAPVGPDTGMIYAVLTVDATGIVRTLFLNGRFADRVTDQLEAQKETSGNVQRLRFGGSDPYMRGWLWSARLTAGVYTERQILDTWESIAEERSIEAEGDQRAQMIDDIAIMDAGGPATHDREQGAGQRIPGPVDQPTGSVGPFDVAGSSDSATPLPVGGPASHSPSIMSIGARVPGPVDAQATDLRGPNLIAGMSDRAIVKLYENLLWPGDETNYAKPANSGGIFDEIEVRLGSVPEFNPYTPTTDPDGHVHLESGEVVAFYIYDTRNEPWSNPTSYPTFTGYGRDGTHYTNGVQDAGPVRAPWSTEGVAGNAHRSTRVDFPELALIAVAANEVIIYDLDNFPMSLSVWMRFQAAQSTAYFFMGRGISAIRDVRMKNGVLYCAANYTPNYSAINGHLTVTDFKRDGDANAHWLIRSDNAHNLTGAFDITDRNTTSWWASGVTSVRLQSERPTRIDVHQDPNDPLRQWIALGGEDQFEVIEFYDGAPAYDYVTTPTPEANLDEGGTRVGMRGVIFDEVGQLYCYERLNDGETRVWRNGLDYQGGVLPHPFLDGYGDLTRRRYPKTVIPAGAVSIAVGRQHVFVATNDSLYENLTGVWAIDRSSFEKKLAYTIAGGGGVGVAGLQGEVLAGDKAPEFVRVWNQQKTTFLFVASLWGGGGVTVVRLLDDQVALSRVWNVLQEDGAYCAAGIVL